MRPLSFVLKLPFKFSNPKKPATTNLYFHRAKLYDSCLLLNWSGDFQDVVWFTSQFQKVGKVPYQRKQYKKCYLYFMCCSPKNYSPSGTSIRYPLDSWSCLTALPECASSRISGCPISQVISAYTSECMSYDDPIIPVFPVS